MDRRDCLTAAGSAATLTLTGTLGRTARADVHDLLSLLEETPRSRIIERVVERIRSGTSYEDPLPPGSPTLTDRGIGPMPRDAERGSYWKPDWLAVQKPDRPGDGRGQNRHDQDHPVLSQPSRIIPVRGHCNQAVG